MLMKLGRGDTVGTNPDGIDHRANATLLINIQLRAPKRRQKVMAVLFPLPPRVGLINCSLCVDVFPSVCDATEGCAALTGAPPCCRRDNGGEAGCAETAAAFPAT